MNDDVGRGERSAPGDHAGRWSPFPVEVDGEHLTLRQVFEVARLDGVPVTLAQSARDAIARSRALVESIVASGETAYGINTGFGDLSTVSIPTDQLSDLQHNLIRSHSAGVGPALPRDVVRAMLLLRANALAKGFSGVREVVVRAADRPA